MKEQTGKEGFNGGADIEGNVFGGAHWNGKEKLLDEQIWGRKPRLLLRKADW